MKRFLSSSSTTTMRLFFLVSLLFTSVVGLNPAIIKGYKFFDSLTGEEIVIRGIDYYPRPNCGELNQNSLDLFSSNKTLRHIWERDIPYFQELGINAIRLYSVNASANHDDFMCALEAAGIYVIVALARDCPTCAVTRDQAPHCYPVELKQQGQDVINAFSKYPNTLGFSTGNEVNHFAPAANPGWNGPCVKKFLRDMREYVDSCSNTMRKIPIGLVVADSDREANAMYYNCQSDPHDEYEYAEWYGLNSYLYCSGESTSYDEALGYQSLQRSWETYGYSIPVLMTEFGCISDTFPNQSGYEAQRNFLQAKWFLERPSLRDLYAGGFAFEYSIEYENAAAESPYPFTKHGHQNYGIGYFGPEDCDDITSPCDYHPMPSFDNLKKAYSESNIVNLTTFDNFVVPEDRQGRSPCPDNFPAINEFVWKTDKTPFSSCPSKKTFEFTCSARGHYNTFEGDHEENMSKMLLVLIFGMMVCVFSLGCVLLQYQRNKQNDVNDVLPWISVPIKIDDATSQGSLEESTGLLLSQKSMDDSKVPYESISSDSSSENLAAQVH